MEDLFATILGGALILMGGVGYAAYRLSDRNAWVGVGAAAAIPVAAITYSRYATRNVNVYVPPPREMPQQPVLAGW